jgi:hypothetical protein
VIAGLGDEIKSTITGAMGVGTKRDNGNAVALADRETAAREMLLHERERLIPTGTQAGRIGTAIIVLVQERIDHAHHSDIRLVTVVLEKHPLQNLRMFVTSIR